MSGALPGPIPQTNSIEREGYFSAAQELIDKVQINEIEMLTTKRYLMNIPFPITLLLLHRKICSVWTARSEASANAVIHLHLFSLSSLDLQSSRPAFFPFHH